MASGVIFSCALVLTLLRLKDMGVFSSYITCLRTLSSRLSRLLNGLGPACFEDLQSSSQRSISERSREEGELLAGEGIEM